MTETIAQVSEAVALVAQYGLTSVCIVMVIALVIILRACGRLIEAANGATSDIVNRYNAIIVHDLTESRMALQRVTECVEQNTDATTLSAESTKEMARVIGELNAAILMCNRNGSHKQ
jgi:hypothetical protein